MRQCLVFSVLAVLTMSLPVRHVQAQQGFPSISIMLKSTQEFEEDLKYVVEASGEKGKQQWGNIKGILPAFLGGIHAEKPIRVDLVFVKEQMELRFVIPVSAEKSLIGNIEGFAGGKSRRLKKGLYRIDGPAFKGTIRILQGYAIIAANPALTPASFGNPGDSIASLVGAGYDIGAVVKNSATDASERKKVMQEFRREVVGTLKQRDDESESEFNLRKVPVGHQFDELERIFVESEQLMLGWSTDAEKREGRLHLELKSLPDTELQKSISELAAEPSSFAAIERGSNSIFFGKINHTLDSMRQTNITELLKLLRAEAATKLEESTSVEVNKKEAISDAGNLLFDMLEAGNGMGVLDGFIEIEQQDGVRMLTGGIRIADSDSVLKTLEALRKADAEIEINAVEVEGMQFHRVAFAAVDEPALPELLGMTEILVACPTDGTLLYAGGAEAAERIQAVAKAIQDEKQPENDGTFIEVWAKSAPWVEILKDRRLRIEKEAGFDPEKLNKADRKAWNEDVEVRSDALKLFAAGRDTLHMKLQRIENRVVGVTVFGEDLLRFAGLQVAKFSEENLQ